MFLFLLALRFICMEPELLQFNIPSDDNTLFVTNIAYEVGKDEIQSRFGYYGLIYDIYDPQVDKITNEPSTTSNDGDAEGLETEDAAYAANLPKLGDALNSLVNEKELKQSYEAMMFKKESMKPKQVTTDNRQICVDLLLLQVCRPKRHGCFTWRKDCREYNQGELCQKTTEDSGFGASNQQMVSSALEFESHQKCGTCQLLHRL